MKKIYEIHEVPNTLTLVERVRLRAASKGISEDDAAQLMLADEMLERWKREKAEQGNS